MFQGPSFWVSMLVSEEKKKTLQGLLEDHPRTCKWLVPLLVSPPKNRVVGPLPNGRFFMATSEGDGHFTPPQLVGALEAEALNSEFSHQVAGRTKG